MEDKEKKELEQFNKEMYEKIEKTWGKRVLKKVKEAINTEKDRTGEVEMLKVFMEDSKLNFGLELFLDEEHSRLYLYPDGIDNGRESIMLEYNEHVKMIYVNGHGENTSVNFVCGPTQDEVTSCLMTVISKFRKDNDWTWEMPCEERYKAQNN